MAGAEVCENDGQHSERENSNIADEGDNKKEKKDERENQEGK